MTEEVQNVGIYEMQFNAIRGAVAGDLQSAGSQYMQLVLDYVHNGIKTRLQMQELAKAHASNVAKVFDSDATVLSATQTSAVLKLNSGLLMLKYDLASSIAAATSVAMQRPLVFNDSLDCTTLIMEARQIQKLLDTPIDDVLIGDYHACLEQLEQSKASIDAMRAKLFDLIRARAFTAFEFDQPFSLYTLNFSDDMTMLFWDRFTITGGNAKSTYIEQYCTVEHVLSGEVEPERFIALHKPVKNSVPWFLAARYACMTELQLPVATINAESTAG